MSGSRQPDEMLLRELTVSIWRRFDPADDRSRALIEAETSALERAAIGEVERSLAVVAARIAARYPQLVCRWHGDEPSGGNAA